MTLTRLPPVLAAFAAALAVSPAAAQEPPGARGTWSLTFENDIFGGSDRDYTNGVRFDYVSPRNRLTALGRLGRNNLGWLTDADKWYESFALGQNIYTPDDISMPIPEPDDRPYAGFLYVGYGLSADRGDRLDTLQLEVGMVGPASLAEQSQSLVHNLIGAQDPKGWDTQLENEPGFRLIYERKYRYGADIPVPLLDLSVDAAPHFNIALGNVDTSAGIGGTVRIGQDLADDYGPPRVRPAVSSPGFFRNEDDFSWYLFAGVEGRVVGRNIFLEGNTFGGVDGVTINRFVGDVQVGAALQFGRVELAYTHVIRTEEYAGQEGPSNFGSVNLRARF